MITDNGKNGEVVFLERFDKLDKEMIEIKDDLSHSVRDLSHAVTRLTDRLDSFILLAQHSIPIKMVFWMFVILVLALAGVEGIQAFVKMHLI